MKLPNFFNFGPLNDAKAKMGIPRNVYGRLTVEVDPSRLTAMELEKLTSTDGLDVSIEDVKVLPDGTLSYKDSRVLLYIRDVSNYGRGRDFQPRYHLANCHTLQSMREKKRFDRYVVATRTDGRFKLNLIDSDRVVRSDLFDLSVCQNCLRFLRYDSFRMEMGRSERMSAVRSFSIATFFSKYPKSLHITIPTYDADNAPLNNYSTDFDVISLNVRETADWICQRCGVDLSLSEHQKFLHVHHLNGQKSDNRPENLEAICFGCHANEPYHHHMKSHPTYAEFNSIRMRLRVES